MATIKAFECIRPDKAVADREAALPYDVYNREESCQEVAREPLSFLAIDRAETQFDSSVDTYADEVYDKARQLLDERIADGTFITDTDKSYYVYELTMNGRVQTGIVACASIDDYQNNVIKKHENTRADKEADRINHVDRCSAQTGPIFLAYRANDVIREEVAKAKKEEPLYSFTSPDGIRHQVYKIADKEAVDNIKNAFAGINDIYIADGHHRAASAVKVGLKRRAEHPDYTGDEEFNYFLSVLFPDEELMIMPYNRVVKDLNGYSSEEFMKIISEKFDIEESKEAVSPAKKADFGMYLDDKWYKLTAKQDKTMVKDYSLPISNSIVLMADLHLDTNTDDYMLIYDTLVEAIASISYYLIENDTPHKVVWYDKKKDNSEVVNVTDEESARLLISLLLQASVYDEPDLSMINYINEPERYKCGHLMYFSPAYNSNLSGVMNDNDLAFRYSYMLITNKKKDDVINDEFAEVVNVTAKHVAESIQEICL